MKLSQSGFKDHEDNKERLKQYDRRTIAFDNRERIKEFFLDLDAYLTNTPDLPLEHVYILELFSRGMRVKGPGGIVEQTGKPSSSIRKIIAHYKKIVLNQLK